MHFIGLYNALTHINTKIKQHMDYIWNNLKSCLKVKYIMNNKQ